MPVEYCTFAIGRVSQTSYEVPGGETVVCPKGETKPLQDWWDTYQEKLTQAHEAEVAAWTADIEAKLAALPVQTVERRIDTGGLRRAKVQMDLITFPDGQVEEYEQGKWRQSAKERLQKLQPRPTQPPEYFGAWMNRLEKEDIRTWEAHLYLDGGVRAIDFDRKQGWHYGLPIKFVMATLNELSTDGWVLQHASEDHGLYRGADAANEAFPARVRYLLSRNV